MSNWLVDNWLVATGFAAGLVTWGKTVNDVAKNKEDIKNALVSIGAMKDSVARIETHIEYTKEALDELRGRK